MNKKKIFSNRRKVKQKKDKRKNTKEKNRERDREREREGEGERRAKKWKKTNKPLFDNKLWKSSNEEESFENNLEW